MVADEQTQRLPADETDAEALRAVLRLCRISKAFSRGAHCAGRDRAAPLRAAVRGRAGACIRHRQPRLHRDNGRSRDVSPRLRGSASMSRSAQPRPFAAGISAVAPAITTQRAREVLTEFVPALASRARRHADPDAALAALDRAFGRMPAAVELLTILQSHDRLRLLFADLLGTAPRLADTVAQSPHVLDALIDPAFVDPLERRGGDRGTGAPDSSANPADLRRVSRPHPRRGAPDALRHRRAAPLRHPLSGAARARPMRPSRCGDRARLLR